MRFYGYGCRHYTVANSSNSTRVSFDFRVVPVSENRVALVPAVSEVTQPESRERASSEQGEGRDQNIPNASSLLVESKPQDEGESQSTCVSPIGLKVDTCMPVACESGGTCFGASALAKVQSAHLVPVQCGENAAKSDIVPSQCPAESDSLPQRRSDIKSDIGFCDSSTSETDAPAVASAGSRRRSPILAMATYGALSAGVFRASSALKQAKKFLIGDFEALHSRHV